MAALDIVGTVTDRLVGGMMFHSEHADLCRWLGLTWLAKMHEDGYEHDAKCLRKVRRLCIDRFGTFPTEGRQERGHALDAYRNIHSWAIKADVRETALKASVEGWVDWEASTVTILTGAHSQLQGELMMADAFRKLAVDTSVELAGARRIMAEMDACGWDIVHAYDMGRD